MEKRDINGEKVVQITNVAKQIERAIHDIYILAWLKWSKTGIVITSSFNLRLNLSTSK